MCNIKTKFQSMTFQLLVAPKWIRFHLCDFEHNDPAAWNAFPHAVCTETYCNREAQSNDTEGEMGSFSYNPDCQVMIFASNQEEL